jgi:uncharacterized protein (DUF58 family)
MLKLIDYFANNAKTNRVFIIPTFLGIKLLIVNIILLSMGLIYANNYLILFNFIFFCLFIISMFYTHFNLYGLELKLADCSENFANDFFEISLKFKTPNKQTYPAIFTCFKILNENYRLGPFSINDNGDVVPIKFKLQKRGSFLVKKIELETLFPLNLFKAFCYFKSDLNIVVYPELVNTYKSGNDSLASQINEDFHFDLRDYVKGDKLNRIAWKKSREDSLKTKVEINDDGNAVVFKLDQIPADKTEYELSVLASSIKRCHDQGIPYGLSTSKHIIKPSKPSATQLKNTMRILAEYET